MNIDFNKILSNILQPENIGKKITEVLKVSHQEVDNTLSAFREKILQKKDSDQSLEMDSNVEDWEQIWKEIDLDSNAEITPKIQEKLQLLDQKAKIILGLNHESASAQHKQPLEEAQEISTAEEEKKEIAPPEIDNLPHFITNRALMGDKLDTFDPFKLFKWAKYQKNNPPLFKEDAYKNQMEYAGLRVLWLEQCFPKLADNERCKDARKALLENGIQIPKHFAEGCNDSFEINEPLTNAYVRLCIGTGRSGENSRKHDPETSYTINLDNFGNPHVSDNITMLSSRNYLNDSQQKPYQFDEIFVEVSCGETDYLYPEFMNFIHDHLKEGGKLYLELGSGLVNESLNVSLTEELDAWAPAYPLQNEPWPWPGEDTKIVKGEIETVIYKYDPEYHEALTFNKFNGNWQDFFSKFGFANIELSKIGPVQMGSLPIELTKKT